MKSRAVTIRGEGKQYQLIKFEWTAISEESVSPGDMETREQEVLSLADSFGIRRIDHMFPEYGVLPYSFLLANPIVGNYSFMETKFSPSFLSFLFSIPTDFSRDGRLMHSQNLGYLLLLIPSFYQGLQTVFCSLVEIGKFLFLFHAYFKSRKYALQNGIFMQSKTPDQERFCGPPLKL